MRSIGKYIGYVALWLVVVAIMVWSHSLAVEHRTTHRVERVDVEWVEQSEHAIIDRAMVDSWIDESGLTPIGLTIANVDIAAIERELRSHSTVAEANAYITYDGALKLRIEARRPIARLRTTGYDLYITEEGYLLPADDGYSVHVPVITGDYAPVFAPDYTGYVDHIVLDSIASLDRHIEELEEAKVPLYTEINDCRRAMRSVTSESVRKGIFMSDREYEILKADLDERKNLARALFNEQRTRLEAEIAVLAEAQDAARRKQQTLRDRLADFRAMVAMFVHIERSTFLHAEVVQTIASSEDNGALSLAIIPRSGRFTVDLGTTEELERKLSTLERFYTNGLDNVGWDRYRNISLRYRGQVVCR